MKRRCSLCESPVVGKTATVYLAWWNGEDDRTAYRMRCCASCFASSLYDVVVGGMDADGDSELCAGCHGPVDASDKMVYATVYLPKRDRFDAELRLCERCSQVLLKAWVISAVLLENRRVEGPSNGAPQLSDPWSQLQLPT